MKICFQALQRLQIGDKRCQGGIFNVTDGFPTHPNFILRPIQAVLASHRTKHNNGQGLSVNKRWKIPGAVAKLAGLFFHCLSIILGHRFDLPSWGLTWMEAHKVRMKLFEFKLI